MNLLLDTCDFLWFVTGDARLSPARREAIESPGNTAFLSAVSSFEITIKHGIGKLPLPDSPQSYIPRCRRRHHIAELPLGERAALLLASLPPHHKDPFDRLLVCQALAHGLTLVSSDPLIHHYQVALL